MPTMSPRQREAAKRVAERHGEVAAREMLEVMGFTPYQIARVFQPDLEQPESGSVIRFSALGTYRYAAIRMGDDWYVTNDGSRRSTTIPKMTWERLLEWGGQQMYDTLEVMTPLGQIYGERIGPALAALLDPDNDDAAARSKAVLFLEGK